MALGLVLEISMPEYNRQWTLTPGIGVARSFVITYIGYPPIKFIKIPRINKSYNYIYYEGIDKSDIN